VRAVALCDRIFEQRRRVHCMYARQVTVPVTIKHRIGVDDLDRCARSNTFNRPILPTCWTCANGSTRNIDRRPC
jgi:hypothetical protein